jgi:hypothetical protein
MKTIKALASHVAKLEGKKSQAHIAQVREILGIVSDLLYAEVANPTTDPGPVVLNVLCEAGFKRAQKKAKAKP